MDTLTNTLSDLDIFDGLDLEDITIRYILKTKTLI